MLPRRNSPTTGSKCKNYDEFILSTEAANIKLEVTGEDLRQFSEELIRRAVGEVADAMTALQGNDLLTKEKVKSMCGVCDATLWHWDKRNYLKPVRVGAKVMYRNADVRRILGMRTPKSDGYDKE